MNDERWDRISELFFESSPLSLDRRAVLLERTCGEDGTLRAEVEHPRSRRRQP